MVAPVTLYPGCAKRLYFATLYVDGVAETGATVAYVLYEADMSTAVSGGSGSLTYAAGTVTIDGTTYAAPNYSAVVTATVTALLTPGADYWLKETVTVSGTLLDTRWTLVIVQRREQT